MMAIFAMIMGCSSAPANRTTPEPRPIARPPMTSSTLNAQDEQEPVPCMLTGTWTGEAWRINSRGPSRFHDRLEITCDSNGLLKATRSWKTLEGAGGHKGMTPVNQDTEELIGVFNPGTGEFHLVETDEPGTIVGRLLDENTIELVSTQPGRQPSISREELQRTQIQ